MTKRDIYRQYNIIYKGGKLVSPIDGPNGAIMVSPLLINGNAKLGRGVYTWSTLPGTGLYKFNPYGDDLAAYDGEGVVEYNVRGTCPCNCEGCYAQTGFYRMASTVKALTIRTIFARYYLDFMRDAIIAQIKADGIKLVRIHAAGDFFGLDYIRAWREIARACPETLFWTYTKFEYAVNAFDDLDNVNVVKSVIPGKGFNFGHCDYILAVYEYLKNAGKRVYICRCGIDSNQHCVNCRGCVDNDYVLFIEHSTAYKAESDPLFPILKNIIENQARA